MMKIVIDIGNSYIKAALFKEGEILWQGQSKPEAFIAYIKPIFSNYKPIDKLIYSASGKIDVSILNYFNAQSEVIAFTHQTKIPFTIDYQTPETLGLDRLALMAAAHFFYPFQNVLVIDAGTCITYDFMSKENRYLGGSISPGLDMRFKALNHFTAALPRLYLENPKTQPIGKNTKDAILNGVIQGVVYEIDQNIERYISDYKDLTLILTGGDQQYLSTKLKNSIFANLNFQLYGLHAILEYQLND